MNNLKNDYFMNYEKFFGSSVMEFVQRNAMEEWIASAGGKIHLDIFVWDYSTYHSGFAWSGSLWEITCAN